MSSQQIAVPQQRPDREGDVSMHIPKGSHVHQHCCQAVLAHTRALARRHTRCSQVQFCCSNGPFQ